MVKKAHDPLLSKLFHETFIDTPQCCNVSSVRKMVLGYSTKNVSYS